MDDHSSDRLFPSWLVWVIAPVTVLAAAIIILALVLGIRAGQRQVESQRRQQVGIAIQRAMDYRTEGHLEEALSEYQRVLVLDPGNAAAVSGIESLLEIAAGTTANVAQSASAPAINSQDDETMTAPSTVQAPASPTTVSAVEKTFEQGLSAYKAGEWRTAERLLTELSAESPDYNAAEVEETLYNIYVNLAAELDQKGELEQALAYVDKALVLHPEETALRDARELAVAYLDVLTVSGADWVRTIEKLEELYVADPGYRDVKQRLWEAHLALGESLAEGEMWCDAASHYRSAVAIVTTTDTIARRDELEQFCELLEGPDAVLAEGSVARMPAGMTPGPSARPAADTTPDIDAGDDSALASLATPEPIPTIAPAPAPSSSAPTGRIMYSAKDPVTGRINIYIKDIASNTPATLLIEEGQQAEFRPDANRVVFKNLRGDMRGLSSLDPDTGLELRFTDFEEDARPSWNGEGNRVAFASNREGDRRWRVYSLWADVGSEAQLLTYGESPAWSRANDAIAYRGCDDSGNRCGIWLMNGGGGDRRPLTTVQADDRPAWSPNGAFVAFMSNGRDGNPEIYGISSTGGEVVRLTDNGAIDGLPALSPDGAWVAFISNRSGSWAVYAVPSAGGETQALFTISGALDAWQEHSLQWLP